MINKRVISLGLVFSMACSTLSATEIFNGKTLALAGTGMASADHRNGVLLNPALTAKFSEDDNFAMNGNGGFLASDQDDLIDNGESLKDLLDELEATNPDQFQIEEAIGLLTSIDEKFARINAGAILQFSIPNDYVPAALFVTGSLDVGFSTLISDADIAYLNSLINNPTPLDTDLLQSEVVAVGASLIEYGVALAKEFDFAGHTTLIGISPKIQEVETFAYIESVANFDGDDFDAEDYLQDDSNFNLDVGAHYVYDEHWNFAVVIKNLIGNDYETRSGGLLTIEPVLTVGAAYKNSWVRTEVNIDMNSAQDFVNGEDSQMARLGVEFDALDWAQFRLGYVHDIEGARDDAASVGFGFSPFGVVNFDLALMAGKNDTYGLAMQIGFNF